MSDALAAAWAACRAARRAALIPYVTAGFPDRDATRAVLAGAAAAGADLVELGIPWSDPVADGPVIQASSQAALAGGMRPVDVLALLAQAPSSVPVVLFSYVNPVLAYGAQRFARDARAAGAAGLLVVDLPVDEDPATEAALRSADLPLVRLVAPTTPARRLVRIAGASEGFVYLVARLGVTGATQRLEDALGARVAAVRAVTTLPVAVGFGVSSGDQAAAVAALADGVVIGSAVVERLGAGGASGALAWLADVRTAMDGVARA